MTDPKPYSPDNPFAKRYSPDNPFTGKVTLGPLTVVGTSDAERTRALTQATAGGDIGAALELGSRQSNIPAMQQAQRAMAPSTAGTAADIALGQFASPLSNRMADEATSESLRRYVAGGGDAGAHANLFGAAAATGAAAGNVGLGAAIPETEAIRPGMRLGQIGKVLLTRAAIEGTVGAGLGASGAALDHETPGAIARQALETGANFAALGTAGTALSGAGAIRRALANRIADLYPEGQVGRVIRDFPPVTEVARDADGTVHFSDGSSTKEPWNAPKPQFVQRPPAEPLPSEVLARTPRRSTQLDENGQLLPVQRLTQPPEPVFVPKEGVEYAQPGVRKVTRTAPEAQAAANIPPISPPEPAIPPEPPPVAPRYEDAPTGRQLAEPVPALPSLDETGTGAPRILAGLTGGLGGAAYGGTQGNTPRERAKNALLYGLGGLAAGVAGGYAAERIGRSPAVEEAALESGKSLAQAGKLGTRFIDRSPPTPFKDAPPPLKLLTDTPPEGTPSVGDATTPYVNLSKFGIERDAQTRLKTEAERVGTELQGNPRRTATWEEWRDAASSLGLGDVTRKDYRAMQPADLLAIRNLVATNTDRLIQLDTQLGDPSLSATERGRIALEQSALNSQNDVLLRKFIPARTAAGRVLNSLKIVASRTFEPTWWLAKAVDIKGSPLTDAEAAQIRGLLNAQDRQGLVETIARMRQATFGEKLSSFWKANLLSSPKTHLVNTAANATLGTLEVAKDVPAAFVDRVLSLATGRRTLQGPTLLQAKAAAEGAADGARQAWQILKGNMPSEELAKLDIPKETHFDNPVLEAYTQGIFRLLGAADRIPRMAAMRRSLANQAEVLAHTERLTGDAYTQRVHDLIQTPTAEMAVRATAEAEQAVVQDQTALGNAAKAVSRIPVVGPYVMPFARTPGAVATRIGEYTFGMPAALASTVAKAARGELQGMSVADQRQLSTLAGRGATGVSLIALGAWAYHKGLLTAPPADWTQDRSQATTDAMRQVQGNSGVLTLGGRRFQLDVGRLSPFGNLVSLGAMAAKAAEDQDSETSPTAALATGAIQTVGNQPFLQGVQNVADAMQDPARAGSKLASNFARGFIPAAGLMGAVTRATDPQSRIANSFWDQLKSQIPDLSRTLPARPNPLGEPATRQGGVLGAVNQVSPVAITEQRRDPVLDALGTYQLPLTGFGQKKGESVADYQTRAAALGQLRREELDYVLHSDAWQQDTTFDGRRALLKDALARAEHRGAQVTRQARVLGGYSTANPFAP